MCLPMLGYSSGKILAGSYFLLVFISLLDKMVGTNRNGRRKLGVHVPSHLFHLSPPAMQGCCYSVCWQEVLQSLLPLPLPISVMQWKRKREGMDCTTATQSWPYLANPGLTSQGTKGKADLSVLKSY